jgi:peptidoglycan-associated lipoprotein
MWKDMVQSRIGFLLVLLAVTQLVGCGWYMRPGRNKAQFAAGPPMDGGWGTGAGMGAGAGAGSDAFGAGGAGAGAGAGTGTGWDTTGGAGMESSEKTRLGGSPKYMLETVYFDFDSSSLRPDQLRTLQRNLAWMQQNPGAPVRLEGHCDERGTEEYNIALGDRRADAARDWLISQGVSPGRIETVSRGELEPAVIGGGEEAWSKNRRVEFLVLE